MKCKECKEDVWVLHNNLCYHCNKAKEPNFDFRKIPITAEMLERAKSRAEEYVKVLRARGHKFTTGDLKNNLTNFCGVECFMKFLIDNEISYQFINYGDQQYIYNFRIKGIYIKTKSNHREQSVASLDPNGDTYVTQISKYRNNTLSEIYVSFLMDNEYKNGYVMGFVTRSMLEKLTPVLGKNMKYPAYRIPIRDLRPIKEFVEECKR